MKRILSLLLVFSLFSLGCVVGTAPDMSGNMNDCISSLAVEYGQSSNVLGANVTINPVHKKFTFNGWANDRCVPVVSERKYLTRSGHRVLTNVVLPDDSNCYYTRDEISSGGMNNTVVLLLSRCSIPKSQSVWIGQGDTVDIQFTQYQTN